MILMNAPPPDRCQEGREHKEMCNHRLQANSPGGSGRRNLIKILSTNNMIFIIIIFMKSTSTVKSANYYGLALNAIFLKQSSAKEFYSALLIKFPAKKKKLLQDSLETIIKILNHQIEISSAKFCLRTVGVLVN